MDQQTRPTRRPKAERISKQHTRPSQRTRRQPRIPQPRKQGLKPFKWLNKYTPHAALLGTGMGLVAILLLGSVGLFSLYIYYQVGGLILPGVHVGETDLSGLNADEAVLALSEAWNGERGLIIATDDRTWYAAPTDFGLSLDPRATAQAAMDIGHAGGIFAEFSTLLDTSLNGATVAPVARIDSEMARIGLTTWAETIDQSPEDATIAIQEGQVIALPGVQGYALNVEATLAVLVSDPNAALIDGYLPLVLEPVAPEIIDVSQALAQAEALLSDDLIVQGYDPISNEHIQWTASPETIAGWLTVSDSEQGPQATISTARLNDYLGGLSDQIGAGRGFDIAESATLIQLALENDSPAAGLIITHPPTTYTVQAGDTLIRVSWAVGVPYWRILESNPGLDADALSVGEVLSIPSQDELLPLPIIVNKRIIVSINDQRLYAYEDGQLIYDWVISTGIDRSPTQPGIFQVQTHDPLAYASVWDLDMPNFIGIYESWPGFMNGFHGLPTRDGNQLLWADSLGERVSFGCIVLDLGNAETLYTWAESGVIVEIVE